MKLRILVAGLMFGSAAMAADSGAELFQKAVTQERAAGNLEEAIKLYQRVAKEFASDRALAAKALVQEARCYEKLGQDKAVKVYEQVARDFGDQREPAATASARLSALRLGDRPVVQATMTQRKIELPFSDTSMDPSLLTDGQREVYRDAATGALMISDLAGRDKRVIFRPKADVVRSYAPSRDLSMLAMSLTRPDGSNIAAVIKTDGTGYREIMTGSSCVPGWSFDNRYLLVCMSQPDGTRQLLRVSLTDGEIRKVGETDSPLHLPSPDGRFLATTNGGGLRVLGKISVAPSQGGEPQVVCDRARLIDWTRDGRYLIIAGELSGPEALYLLPMKDGRQAGDPVFIRYGSFRRGRTTPGGALLYQSTPQGGGYAAWLGTLDSGSRLVDWRRLNLRGGSQIAFSTRWSPDSTQITYAAPDEAIGQNTWVVRLRNIASGEEREVYRADNGRPSCIWAAQRADLFCTLFNATNIVDVFSISIASGRVEKLGSLNGVINGTPFFSSGDDTAIYLLRDLLRNGLQGPGDEMIRWDLGTHQATTVDRIPGIWNGTGLGIPYPNERWIARRDKGTIETRPMSGGSWKPLISLSPTQMAFTPDGNWLLYHDVDAAGKHSLFRVATAGGKPERVGDFPVANKEGYLRISPDGQKIIAEASKAPEVWMLENFEPRQQAAK